MILVRDPLNVDRLIALWMLQRYGGLGDIPVVFLAQPSAILDDPSVAACIDIPTHRPGIDVFMSPHLAEKVWQKYRSESQMDHLVPLLADIQYGHVLAITANLQAYFRVLRPVREVLDTVFDYMDTVDLRLRHTALQGVQYDPAH